MEETSAGAEQTDSGEMYFMPNTVYRLQLWITRSKCKTSKAGSKNWEWCAFTSANNPAFLKMAPDFP